MSERDEMLKLADSLEYSLKGYARNCGRVVAYYDPADYDKMVAALRLAARPDREGLEAEVTRLRKGIQDHLDGNYDHPRKYRSQGPQSTCPHHRYYYEECGECNDAHLKSLLHPEQTPVSTPPPRP